MDSPTLSTRYLEETLKEIKLKLLRSYYNIVDNKDYDKIFGYGKTYSNNSS